MTRALAGAPFVVVNTAGKFNTDLLTFGKWVSYDAEDVADANNIIATIPSGGTVIFLK